MKLKDLKDETVLNKIVEIIKETRIKLLADVEKRQPYYNSISFIIKREEGEKSRRSWFYPHEIYEELLYVKNTTGEWGLIDEEKIKSTIEERIKEIENEHSGEQNVKFAMEFRKVYAYEKQHKELDLLLNERTRKITR